MSKFKLLFPAAALFLAGFLSGSPVLAADPVDINFNPYPSMIYPVRVGLSCRSALSYIVVWYPGALFVDEKPVFALAPRHVYSLRHGFITELATGKSYRLPQNRRAYITSAGYQVWTNNRWYSGSLELVTRGERITVINLLDLEEYLRGVVPAEMPANWHLEALKAQAVAARSYAYAHLNGGSKWYHTEGYDLVPDVRDQVYKGLAVRANSSDWAIKLTHGIVLKDSGRVKPGFYRAWVGDNFENLNMRQSKVNNALLEKITAVPSIIGVTVKQWDQTGNARSIQVIGTSKSCEVDGIALAKMLHFSTAGILDVKQLGNEWLFTYRGPGNGSRGLSQHGANMLAARGWPFDQILQQYYQDPDGHLRFARLDGYYYGDDRWYRRREIKTAKTDIKKHDQPGTGITKTEASTPDETIKDEHKKDASGSDEIKSNDSKTADSKPEDSTTTE